MPRKRTNHFALIDSAFASDPKFMRLARATDSLQYAAAIGVWTLLLATARRSKSPVIDWEDWDEWDEQIEQLRRVNLLTNEGFDAESFEAWAPAYRSPAERPDALSRNGTQGYAEEREDTVRSLPSIQLTSTPFSSSPTGATVSESTPRTNGVSELNAADPFDAYILLTGRTPRDGGLEWLNRLEAEYGGEKVAFALKAAWLAEPKVTTLLSRAEAMVAVEKRREEEKSTIELGGEQVVIRPGTHAGQHPDCYVCGTATDGD